MFSVLHDFWINDGVVMTVWSRGIIYGGLFVLAMIAPWVKGPHGDSPLHAKALFLHTNYYYVNQVNAFSRAFSFLHNEVALTWITRIVVVAWLLCIVGLGGFVSRLTCGVGILLLATMIYGFKKLNGHRWWVASFALFFMAFTDCFQELSLDAWLSNRFPSYPVLEPEWNLMHSGFASKFILAIAAYTLVAGGIAKVRNGGWGWFSGKSFFFYIGDPKHTRLPRIVGWMQRHPLVVTTMAVGSVVFEIGSIVPIFVAEVRVPWVFLAIAFHVGIWVLMSPKYFPQCVSYLAVISGPQIGADVEPVSQDVSTTAGVIVGLVFAVGHVFAVLARYEAWPLTHIPMYSYNRCSFSHEVLTRDNLNDLVKQVGGLLKISKKTISVPQDLREVDLRIPKRIEAKLRKADPKKRRVSFKSSGGGGLFSTNWFLLTTPESGGADVTRELCFYFCAETTYFRRRLMAALMRYYGEGEETDILDYLRLTLHLLRKVPGHEAAETLDLVVPLDGRSAPIASARVDGDDISAEIAADWRIDGQKNAA